SLPLERSISRPATAGAPGCGGQPSSGSTLPSPSASRFGRSSPPTARATFPSVSDPSSPYVSASGRAPAPTASSTITQARGSAPPGDVGTAPGDPRSYSKTAMETVLGLLGIA